MSPNCLLKPVYKLSIVLSQLGMCVVRFGAVCTQNRNRNHIGAVSKIQNRNQTKYHWCGSVYNISGSDFIWCGSVFKP